jgi:chorismate synthase
VIDFENIKKELGRRKPGQSNITTQRKEDDENFEVLSGIFE